MQGLYTLVHIPVYAWQFKSGQVYAVHLTNMVASVHVQAP